LNTVALTLICKNEIANIGELLNRVCPVLDEVHVVDTGSTDGTREVIKGLGYPNLHLYHFDWVDDFSAARNFSLSKVKSADWVFWLDCDDLIDPVALKKFKDEVLDDPAVDVWCLPYNYGGKTVISRERFVRRSVSPKWQCAIHEYLGHSSSKIRHYDGLKVTHNHVGKVREAGRNLRILAKEYEKDPSHTRMSYYYGKELFDAGEHEKAKQVLQAYLDLPVGKYYDDEVSARYRLAMMHVKDKQYQKALDVAERIYHLSRERNRAEYYYVFGEVELALGNIAQAATWYERCLCQPPERGVINGHLWTTMPLNRLLQCNRDLGRWDEVFKWVDRARQYPECAYWIEQVTQYRVHPKEGASEVNLEFGLSALPNAYRVGEEPLLVNIGSYMKFKPTNWVLGERLPFMSGSVDGVAVDTSRSKVLVSELVRVLKPGGKFISPLPLEDAGLNTSLVVQHKKIRRSTHKCRQQQVDVIIPSRTDLFYRQMVVDCIETLRRSEREVRFNVVVVESEHKSPQHVGQDVTLQWPADRPFNYNGALNLGIQNTSSDWVALCNNDILFHPGWFTEIDRLNSLHPEFESFSCWNTYEDWHARRFPTLSADAEYVMDDRVCYGLAGWIMVVKRSLLERIDLSDRVNLWYSDNIYADELRRLGKPHVLSVHSKVDHLRSQTLGKEKYDSSEDYNNYLRKGPAGTPT